MTLVVTFMDICSLFVVPLARSRERTNVLLWRPTAHPLPCLMFHTNRILNLFLCSCSFSGAYLVPYFILLILIGIPLFFLELAVGQRIRRGSIGVWNYVYPQLGGIGVSSLMVTTLLFRSKQELEGAGYETSPCQTHNLSLSNKGRDINDAL